MCVGGSGGGILIKVTFHNSVSFFSLSLTTLCLNCGLRVCGTSWISRSIWSTVRVRGDISFQIGTNMRGLLCEGVMIWVPLYLSH